MPLKKRSQRGIFFIIIETASVKAVQLEETKSMEVTPLKKTESVHNVFFYITENH